MLQFEATKPKGTSMNYDVVRYLHAGTLYARWWPTERIFFATNGWRYTMFGFDQIEFDAGCWHNMNHYIKVRPENQYDPLTAKNSSNYTFFCTTTADGFRNRMPISYVGHPKAMRNLLELGERFDKSKVIDVRINGDLWTNLVNQASEALGWSRVTLPSGNLWTNAVPILCGGSNRG